MLIMAVIAASSWLQLISISEGKITAMIENVTPSLSVKNSRNFGAVKGRSKENARFTFDLNANLSELFNWNTKQVFTYLTAEYNGTKQEDRRNAVTIWDCIIVDKLGSTIELKQQRSKYSLWDLEEKLGGRDLVLKLHWNVQPYLGLLQYGSIQNTTIITLPDRNLKDKSTDGI